MTDTKRLADDLREFASMDCCPEIHHGKVLEAADLIARLPEMERDAERYRWLRERHRNPYIQLNVPPYGAAIISGTECDEVIDAKLAASSTGDAGEKGNG